MLSAYQQIWLWSTHSDKLTDFNIEKPLWVTAQSKPGEPLLVLNAFVLSPTKFSDLLNMGDPTKKAALEDRNVLFMEEGGNAYLKKLFAKVAAA